jgi:hypothetical protein
MKHEFDLPDLPAGFEWLVVTVSVRKDEANDDGSLEDVKQRAAYAAGAAMKARYGVPA